MEDPRPDFAVRTIPVMEEVIRWVGVLTDHKISDPKAVQAMVELRDLVEREIAWIDVNWNMDPLIKTNDTLWAYTSSLAQIAHALDRQKAVFPKFAPGAATRIVMAGVVIEKQLLDKYKAAAARLPEEPVH